jgi:23S rRNA pseudouridine1911/1915/1917 synthase
MHIQEDPDLEQGATDETDELYERLSIVVDKGQEPLRIDKFLQQRIVKATRNKIQKAIELGHVLVNEKPVKTNYKIRPGDSIITYSETVPESFEVLPEKMDLNIVYEDEDIMVINKPAGLVVHPGSGNYSGTLLNGIAWYLKQQQPDLDENTLPRFGMVHRIDKNTSGLLLLAKSDKAAVDLANQFFDHTVERKYLALVWGNFDEDEGTVTGHVGRHVKLRKIMDVFPDGEHGKEATTHYKVVERFNYVTLIECRLETGRTHQIRVHMQHIGQSLFNDDTYGGDRIVKGTIFTKYKQFVENCFAICPRHALHAQTLGFTHPRTRKRMIFNSEVPDDIEAVLEKWRRYTTAKNQTT